jgi:hypothetical protein
MVAVVVVVVVLSIKECYGRNHIYQYRHKCNDIRYRHKGIETNISSENVDSTTKKKERRKKRKNQTS